MRPNPLTERFAMPSEQGPLIPEPSEEEALAAFFAAATLTTLYLSHKAYKFLKARRQRKKFEAETSLGRKTSLLDMKAIHEEWNV
jgi:hypothetical protein